MKRSTLFLAIILLFAVLSSLTSCKKDEETKPGNTVTYGVECDSCTFTFSALNNPNKTVEVKKIFIRSEINDLKLINISVTGTGKIRTKLTVNDKVIHDVTNNQIGNTVNYRIKVK